MDSLMLNDDAANRPLFTREGPEDLIEPAIPTGQLSLAGPSEKLDAANWPIRGDLAHIRLAGRCFVPHYSAPMPHVVMAPGAVLRKLGQPEADALAELAGGAHFDVLDMAGGWCWGQVTGHGLVGYIPHDRLTPLAT
jgi:hypothetical protein